MDAPVVGRERNRASDIRNGLAIGVFVFCVSLPSFCGGQFASWNGFDYIVSGTDITIMGYTGPPGNVAIPSSIPGVKGSVTSIYDEAFMEWGGLTSITIPDSVTSIGDSAFEACGGLTNITLSDSVTNLGEEAFGLCSRLATLTLPGSVTSLADGLCYGCAGLTTITIPDSVTSIGAGAFQYCTSLRSVIFEGNAPSPTNDPSVFEEDTGNPVAYYSAGAAGWGSTFDGIPTQPVNPPVAGTAGYTRAWNVSLLINISDLLTNVTGGPVTLIGVGRDGYNLLSAGGTTLFTNTTFILYTNSVTPNANDSFQYTVQNAQGQTAMGTVNLTINSANILGQTASIVVGSSGVTVNFFGVPNYSYTAERSTDWVNWVAIASNLVAPTNGLMRVADDFHDLGTPPPSAFYRLRYAP